MMAFHKGKKWTKAEERKLMELKTKGWKYKDIAKVINRKPRAMSIKYQKLSKYEELRDIKPGKCPVCGNTHIGKVDTYVTSAEKGYFCRNCLTEWTDKGILKPEYA